MFERGSWERTAGLGASAIAAGVLLASCSVETSITTTVGDAPAGTSAMAYCKYDDNTYDTQVKGQPSRVHLALGDFAAADHAKILDKVDPC